MNSFIPLRIVFFLRMVLFNFVILFVLRVAFYLKYVPEDFGIINLKELVWAFYLGGKFDLRLILVIMTPFLLFYKIWLLFFSRIFL